MSKRFNARIIAQVSLLSAIAVVLLLIEFPVFPTAAHLKLNFSDMPALIAAFAFGPVEGLIVTAVKVLLFFFIRGSSSGGVGEIANLIIGASYVLPAAFIYKRKKSIKTAVIALAVSSAAFIAAAFLANLFMLLPAYGVPKDARLALAVFPTLPFNAIKAVGTSILTFIVYKPAAKALKMLPDMYIGKKALQSGSPAQTEKIAFEIAQKSKGGEVYILDGEMGAGKTVFAKGFARGLGVTETVTSPTFTAHNIYDGRLKLHHFDFYRFNEKEAEHLGLHEFFGDPESVCLVEWGANVKNLLPREAKTVKIVITGETTRLLELVK